MRRVFVVARQRQAHIYANICAMLKRHQFAGSLHKSLVAPFSLFVLYLCLRLVEK
jgi:hypothetical protein